MSSILPMPQKNAHVAIIGAGLAGLSCAQALKHAGIEVTVIEKSRGVAGRMSTRKGKDWQCDHGARYFTARDPAFQAQLTQWLQSRVAAPWSAQIGVYENNRWMPSKSTDIRYVGTPFMTSPAQHLAKSLTVHTNHTVSHIQQSGQQWCLHTKEQEQLNLKADWLVLAIPAPQAKALISTSKVATNTAIDLLHERAKTQGCWTMMLQFEKPIALPFEAAFINQGILSWVARDNSKPLRAGSETWVIHGDAKWSQSQLDDEPETIAPKMIDAFVAIGGKVPATYQIHRWRYASSEPRFKPEYHLDFDLRLGLCGDWLHGGRVEGAWLSGQKLANALLASGHF